MSGLVPRLRALRPELSGAAARVADCVLADPGAVAAMTIRELAAAADTSLATVTRVCHRVGVDGYSEFRIGLASYSGREADDAWRADLGEDIEVTDSLDRVLAVIAQRDAAALRDTVEGLDVAALERACEALAGARRIDIYGVGGSAIVATELQLRLYRIGCATWVWPDVHSALTSAVQLGPDDVAVGISHGGETAETGRPLAVAGRQGAVTIAITNAPGSTLARNAEVVLTTSVRSLSMRPDFLAVRHSQLIVLDGLYLGVAQRTYDRTVGALEATAAEIADHLKAYPVKLAGSSARRRSHRTVDKRDSATTKRTTGAPPTGAASGTDPERRTK